MRPYLLTSAVIMAGVAVAVTAGAAGAVTARPAAVPAATAMAAAAPAAPAGRPVFLVTGQLITANPAGPAGVSITAGTPGQNAGPAGPLEELSLCGTAEVMPVTAVPYLGRGLDPRLFQPRLLAKAESGGRLPVRIAYPGRVPALPGLTITSAGHGTTVGYVTAAGARTFGSALARLYTADHARARYGQDSFLRSVSISLAGVPVPVPVPAFAMHTLTVTATNLRGHPDTGDFVIVGNVDDPTRFSGIDGGDFFDRGAVKLSVPAGHYWAVGVFTSGSGRSERMVVLPQFTVRGATRVHLAERSASSKVGFTTPRPAGLQGGWLTLFRGAGNGDLNVLSLLGGAINGVSLWVSPTTGKPTVGTLQSTTSGQLTSPPGAPGTPYAYNLDYAGPPGVIPAQHFGVSAASLATVHERYYQDVASTGSWCTIGGPVLPGGAYSFGCLYLPLRLPGIQIQHLSTGPGVVWQTSYGQSPSSDAGGQSDVYRSFRAGQQSTVDWNAYPLHPQPDVQALRGSLAARFPSFLSAFRAGNTLALGVTPFSDNRPGHAGTGSAAGPGVKVTGRYAIYQNGRQIAHGNPARGISPVRVTATPAVIRFTLATRRQSPAFPLSPASTTTWTWHTARRPGAAVPSSWACGQTSTGYQRRCAVQPMMTLAYQVAGLALNGTTTPGRQAITLTAGHIPLARATRLPGPPGRVSSTGGKPGRPPTAPPLSRGHSRTTFPAPAGAGVTLQVHATDAAGGSVSETILHGYQVAPAPANGAAR